MENVFSPQISAHQKRYYSQHVLIRLIEEWKKYLNKDFVIGTFLTDLSKAFDCIPYDLLIAKLEAYVEGGKALSDIYSYLANLNQCARIYDKKSNFQKIISGVLQDSIIGPILFNFLINGLFFFVSSASIYNFADDNSLSAITRTVVELKNTLQSESEVVINWFKNIETIVNIEKFQVITLDKHKHDYSQDTIKFDNRLIETVFCQTPRCSNRCQAQL